MNRAIPISLKTRACVLLTPHAPAGGDTRFEALASLFFVTLPETVGVRGWRGHMA